MSFTSIGFLIFLGIVILVYYLVPKKVQWCVLLAASYGFYLIGGWEQVFFLIGATAIGYFAARFMQKRRDAGQNQIAALGDDITKDEKRARKRVLQQRIFKIQVVAVLVFLAVLAFVKYFDLILIGAMGEAQAADLLTNLIVPLGISYYTFNSIGYVIDVGRGKQVAEKHFLKYALFISFFPAIVQGPLHRFGDVGKQLLEPHKFDYNNIKYGIQLMLWGFFKKMVIADRVAVIVSTIFAEGYNYTGSHVFFGAVVYGLQIYCDFSGGIDIARGAAQMMGINLPVNFERPFFATSLPDFWRRWHISLCLWMREYVFYPVMLSRPVAAMSKFARKKFGAYAGKMIPTVCAPFVVFFLIGIWHNISWNYIANGLYMAILISLGVACAPMLRKWNEKLHINTEAFSWRLFQILRTFLLVTISRVIVKAPNIEEAFNMIWSMFTDFDLAFITGANGEIFNFGISQTEMLLVFVCVLILFAVGVAQEKGIKIREAVSKQNIIFRWIIMIVFIVVIITFGVYGPSYDASAFIYGRF